MMNKYILFDVNNQLVSNFDYFMINFERIIYALDFDHLYKVHSAKNTLQGHRIMITEVYETETLAISFIEGSPHPPMTIPRLRQLFGEKRWLQDVFACLSIRHQNSAEIELMNAESLLINILR